MELRRPRGIATFLMFPIVDASGTNITGINPIRPQYATFTDAISPNTKFTTISTATCTEISGTGWYFASLSATEMANDYIVFIASPTSGTGRQVRLLINCTALASVTQVASVTNPVSINWASVYNPNFANNFSVTQIASVNNPAAVNWGSITNVAFTNTFSGTTVATATGVTSSVAPDWGRVINPTSTVGLTNTTIATASNVATCQFLASASQAVLTNVSTVTGVTNTTRANLIQWVSVAPNALIGARVDSYASILNWASVTGATTTVGLSGTTVATTDGVTSSVAPDWGRVANQTTTVNLTNTTVASASNVATCQFVASVSQAVLNNVGTVSGVTNRVDATLTNAAHGQIADRILARNLAGGSDGTRTIQDAFRLLRNRRALTFGAMGTATLSSYSEDDSTVAWTAVISTASAVGLTDVDPV